MQEVFDFVLSHYEAILSVVTLIVSIVILILRKKPLNDVYTDIISWSVYGILEAESSNLPGKAKKIRCMNYVINCLREKYPDIDINNYRKIIDGGIEYILSTPQKKGDNK